MPQGTSAPGFLDGDLGEPRGHGISCEGGKTQFQQGECGDLKVGAAGATIDQHRDADGVAAGLFHDSEALEYATAAGDDVFDDENLFLRGEGETAAQHE